VDPNTVTRPKGTKPYQGDQVALLSEGKALWNSKAISRNNSVSCSSCHQNGTTMLHPDFAKPYPHFVQMVADNNGMKSITLEELVQFCMIKPMQSKPFAWDSRQLAALTAYTAMLQKEFKPVGNAVNPCAARNPCAPKNPCSMRNPCAVRSY
jgi:cytochrome c